MNMKQFFVDMIVQCVRYSVLLTISSCGLSMLMYTLPFEFTYKMDFGACVMSVCGVVMIVKPLCSLIRRDKNE